MYIYIYIYIYTCIDSTSIYVVDSCYERLKEDVLSFREKSKENVVCWVISMPGLVDLYKYMT